MNQSSIKQEIIRELDSRIRRLEDHQKEKDPPVRNQYEELNQAVSKTIGVPLLKELQSIKSYVEKL